MDSTLCCYCGVNPATTRDHVPPKGIFNKPRPSDLITVPSCHQCNNGASGDDEKFKVYLGMHVARYLNNGEILFKKGVLPTVKHNKSLREKIINGFEKVNIVDADENVVGSAIGLLWDSDVHDAVILRITKGLFYHHYNKSLDRDSIIDIHWFDVLPDYDDVPLITASIRNGDFVYAYNKLEGSDDSIWLYQFYNGHWAGAIVTSPSPHEQ